MIASDEQQVSSAVINNPEARNATMKMLIGGEEGWTDHVIRIIELG